MTEEKSKIAVFIDFDNIEIGVRSTLSRRFDIGTVLEAIKERGEVVTKIAYGNWQRAENFSREMADHAVQMVQRNLTPGGDKNGADIHLALDALEMAFTRDHINTFVIVGGDSDFIALVEKLKQYDKTVFIVGGRAFTSVILQRNCHEFIAYENLVGSQPSSRRPGVKSVVTNRLQLEDALRPIRRALKILADRGVSAQLGLLKSTLLQLDPTFSERDFGAGTFQEFMQKMERTGYLNLKQVDRSLIVELKETESPLVEPLSPPPPAEISEPEPAPQAAEPAESTPPAREVKDLFLNSSIRPRWPMYMRGLRQFLRTADPSFTEQRYGFANIHEMARQLQREGLFRLERSRDGVLRIFPSDWLAAELNAKYASETTVSEISAPEPETMVATEPAELPQAGEIPEEPILLEMAPESGQPEPVESAIETVAEKLVSFPPQTEVKPKRRRRSAEALSPKRRTGNVHRSRASKKSPGSYK